jgi:hypothetical protein
MIVQFVLKTVRYATLPPMVLALDEEAADDHKSRHAASALSPVEIEVIDLFVQFSRALGQPRSVAEICGLLFISPRSMPMDQLMERLRLSKRFHEQGAEVPAQPGRRADGLCGRATGGRTTRP